MSTQLFVLLYTTFKVRSDMIGKNQATGMTKISRGVFTSRGAFGFFGQGVYTSVKKPEVGLLALFRL